MQMKRIRRFETVIGGEPGFPQLPEKIAGSKRHPVIFHSRKRYEEAEEEE